MLSLGAAMTYDHDGETAFCLVYNGVAPDGAEARLNSEHVVARWLEPEAYIARFLDPAMLETRDVSAAGIELAREVARAVREAARARGMRLTA